MITQQYRPKTFKEVAGHKNITDVLKCIVKSPDNSPRTIILQGEFGTGKTTCARILARALNCPNQKDGEPCGNCPICNSDLDLSPFYAEYDSAVVGGVDQIRDLRETFYFNSDKGYRVIVLDECHLISKTAQSALLKVFEETKGRIFFVLCTTDAQMLLPTIRSRSLELRFNLIPPDDLKQNIKSIAEKENIQIDDKIVDLIVSRSEGHARNAQMLLDRYQLLGDVFVESVKSSKDDFAKLLWLCAQSSMLKRGLSEGKLPETYRPKLDEYKKNISDIIYKLQCNSLVSLKVDYEDTVLDISKLSVGMNINCDIPELVSFSNYAKQSKQLFIEIFRLLTSDTIVGSFKSDKMFQAAMWVLYISI